MPQTYTEIYIILIRAYIIFNKIEFSEFLDYLNKNQKKIWSKGLPHEINFSPLKDINDI